jgi:hypothetical protein
MLRLHVRHGVQEDLVCLPVIKGFAAVSRDPSPFPIMKMAAQKPPKDLALIHGIEIKAPMAYRTNPQIKTAR